MFWLKIPVLVATKPLTSHQNYTVFLSILYPGNWAIKQVFFLLLLFSGHGQVH